MVRQLVIHRTRPTRALPNFDYMNAGQSRRRLVFFIIRGYATRATSKLPESGARSISLASAIKPSSALHHDLASFIAYSATAYKTSNPYQVGTLYEYQTLMALRNLLGIQVKRCGGPDDRGVDLRGDWRLPSSQMAIVVQCKASKKKCGPEYIRQLGGVVVSEERELKMPTLGILSSQVGFTALAIRQASAAAASSSTTSGIPLALCTIQDENTISGIVLNHAAENLLSGLTIGWVDVERQKSLGGGFKEIKTRGRASSRVEMVPKPILMDGNQIISPEALIE